jgi:hypothetical protein
MNLKSIPVALLVLFTVISALWSGETKSYLLSVINLEHSRSVKLFYLPVPMPGATLTLESQVEHYSGQIKLEWCFNQERMLKGVISAPATKNVPLQSYGKAGLQ